MSDLIGRQKEQGVALITVLLLLLIMTMLGIASITITGMENKMSGFARTNEATSAAAESCIGVGINVVRQTLKPPSDAIPAAFLSNAVPPGPVPVANANFLRYEIKGRDDLMNDMTNNGDSLATAPNLVIPVGGLTVNGDIDRLYSKPTEGTGSSTTIVYRITCMASNVATGASASATAVYGCIMGLGATECSKKIVGGT